MPAASHQARLNFRLVSRHKKLIEQAAVVRGQSVSEFAISALVEKAQGVLDEAKTRKLSVTDTRIFLKMLDNPPAPNAALRRAMRRYKQSNA